MMRIILLMAMFLPKMLWAQTSIEISKDLSLTPLTASTWIHQSYTETPTYGRFSSNGLIFIQDDKAWLFDTPMDLGISALLISYLQDSMNLTIEGFIPNHWHDDCTKGMDLINSLNINTYAYSKTNSILKEEGLAFAKSEFSDSARFTLGGKDIFCFFLGKAHAQDNIVIWLPSENVLFGGCMVKSLKANHMGYIGDADMEQWPKTMDRILDKFKTIEMIIPGHGTPGNMELIYHTKELIERHYE